MRKLRTQAILAKLLWPSLRKACAKLGHVQRETSKATGAAVAEGCVYGLQTAAVADPSRINAAAQVGVQRT